MWLHQILLEKNGSALSIGNYGKDMMTQNKAMNNSYRRRIRARHVETQLFTRIIADKTGSKLTIAESGTD